ncbi:GrpB protein [Paenibacillus algorifonticola]|uniref:GrpB protein n=1 Tax=Paenibacillus algorifonticola TaxID=684063 RepID=A0A1I2HQY0_9BACL|nr:GrpB family protein [Paenibacillus algorifonticola]SFF31720.1 GrpB protein [Paenibacillus algorifonticola]
MVREIDILVVVKDIAIVDSFDEEMAGIGYEARREQGIEGRRYFTKGGFNRTHHVHMYQSGHKNISQHLVFKAYLLAHPEEAGSYGALKLKLAKQFPDHTHYYQAGKKSYVDALMGRAAQWDSGTTHNR